jgi:PAS domain S-box-containing protein
MVAVVTVIAAALAVALLRDFLDRSIFILFAAPIVMASWYGGRGPALLAMAGGLIAADLIFLDRLYFFLPVNPQDDVAIGVYILVGLIIVHLSTLLRNARDEAQRNALQLEEQAMEMEVQATELEQQTEEAQTLSEELQEAHEALKERSSEQLAEAQALAKLGSWEWDVASNRITWSDEMYRLYGLEPGSVEVDYEKYQSMLHPDDRGMSTQIVASALHSGEPFSFHHRVLRADGEERIFHARGRVVMGDDGKAVRMFGTGQDVTDAKRAEVALRNAAEFAAKQETIEAATRHLNRVLSQAPVLIGVLSGPEHRFEMLNDVGMEMIPIRPLIGKPVREALPGVAEQGFAQLLDTVWATGRPFVGREMFARLAGDPASEGKYYNFVFQPLSDESGVYSILVVATDVSDLVSARLAAEQSQHEALAASRAKSDFLARMSHELRTPLAAIMGYGELLSDGITGPVNEEQKKQLNRIRSSANHLLAIIDEILTLARMEAGKEKVRLQQVNVAELMDSVATMAEPLAAAKGLTFNLENGSDGLTVQTDPMKLRQVLLNLISNAVKYTEEGSISVISEASDGQVSFSVKDTGVGVGEEHLEKIFEPFWQVEQTTTRRAGGTGLGLAVTRQFVELLGGRMTVTSKLGEGSSFRVTLPAERPSTIPE